MIWDKCPYEGEQPLLMGIYVNIMIFMDVAPAWRMCSLAVLTVLGAYITICLLPELVEHICAAF